jgi:cation:H+ antiporter
VPALNFGRLTVSAGGVMIAACYFAGMRRLARQGAGRSVLAPSRDEAVSKNRPLAGLGAQLLLNAAIVVVGGMWLARSADVIAWQTGLGGTFFGSIFLALVTSLPEVVVSLSAMKIGSLDLALGNIFGSNMTNMFILFVCGLFYRGGAILGAVSKAHVVTAALSVLLTFVAVKGVFTRNKRTVFGLGLDSLIMIVLFFAGTGILYKFRLY